MKTSRKSLEEELRRGTHKASWESRNEGVHERVNFDDTLWGFSLAGGVYYRTPLRITSVRENSRASFAGIKPGDVLKRINDIDTSTLTIQQAHQMIVDSGINIRLAVSAPDDLETRYNVWQDEYVEDEKEKRKRFAFKQRKIHKEFKGAKTNADWSMMWPWTSKRTPFYRESNCFLVPSRYEDKHPDKIGLHAPKDKNMTMHQKSAAKVDSEIEENVDNADDDYQEKVKIPEELMTENEKQVDVTENLNDFYDDLTNNDDDEEYVRENRGSLSTESDSESENEVMSNQDSDEEGGFTGDEEEFQSTEAIKETSQDQEDIEEGKIYEVEEPDSETEEPL